MAYQLIYTFTGRSNTPTERTIPLSRFSLSGDTGKTLGQITGITFEHAHTSTRRVTWTLRGRLVFGDGTSITSDPYSQTFAGNVLQYVNTFSTLPSADKWPLLTRIEILDQYDSTANGNSEPYLYWRATRDYPMRIIVDFVEEPPTYYEPKIETFSLQRVNSDGVKDDEGNYIATTMKLSLTDNAGLNASALRVYYAANAYPVVGESDYIDLSSQISTLISGVALNPSIISGSWSIADSWYFAAVFVAGNESDVATSSAARAGGSLHIADQPGGGICVGGYSTGTTSNPKNESHAPSYFYGGITQLGNAKASLRAMGMQFGSLDTQSCANGATLFSATFDAPYESAPAVFVTMKSAESAANMGQISCMVIPGSVTNSGFSAYVFNASGTVRSIALDWFAIGVPQYDPNAPISLRRPVAAMTANTSGGCTVSASSIYSGSYPAWCAFDYSLATSWACSTSDTSPWIQMQMNVAMKNIVVKIFARNHAVVQNPIAGTIQGSNDGGTWATIGSFSGWDANANGKLLGEVSCKNTTAYKYVRVNITSHGGSQNYVAIGYIEINGEK